ncbi:MAG: hypothetical protein J5I53_01100 [Bradyrhizobiaceae bacterium]|nr:hypothetical protein [Bradyrhizobiaceae bacterium]
MALFWITIIAIAAYLSTITLVVIGEEYHPLIAVVLFIGLGYLAIKLFQSRVTKI